MQVAIEDDQRREEEELRDEAAESGEEAPSPECIKRLLHTLAAVG